MISAIIIDSEAGGQNRLRNYLLEYCPYIELKGNAKTFHQAEGLITGFNPELLFFNPGIENEALNSLYQLSLSLHFETILITSQEKFIAEAVLQCIAGRLLKPIQSLELILALNSALNRILEKRKSTQGHLIQKFFRIHTLDEIVGIPTMEGFEFIPVSSIIRCEGLQKCARVVSREQSNIVSSYNLGEFKKLLEPFGFFAPHKSHLINLNMIRKYYKEGTILMKDGSHVPVARRRKEAFLQIINRL